MSLPHLEPVCEVHQYGGHIGHAEQHAGELMPGLQVCLALVLSHDLRHSLYLSEGSEPRLSPCAHDLSQPVGWAALAQCLSVAESLRLTPSRSCAVLTAAALPWLLESFDTYGALLGGT